MPGIIVGIDGSGHARHALEWAVNEAAIRHTPLTVLTVNQAVIGWGAPMSYPGDEELMAKARKAAEEETEVVLEKIAAESRPSVTVKAVTGLPGEALMNAAAAADADMIVVGSRGAGGFKRLLMGSVSTQVTHHAHCPVVVIPADRN
ncbi:MAG TPA: universal stress protein [Trebonia sp.]|nr:universal stress protein [Trebonia sp.]